MGSIPGLENPLEKEMATHSSNLVREISWTEEFGGLQSTGSQRVRHDLANEHKHKCMTYIVVEATSRYLR